MIAKKILVALALGAFCVGLGADLGTADAKTVPVLDRRASKVQKAKPKPFKYAKTERLNLRQNGKTVDFVKATGDGKSSLLRGKAQAQIDQANTASGGASDSLATNAASNNSKVQALDTINLFDDSTTEPITTPINDKLSSNYADVVASTTTTAAAAGQSDNAGGLDNNTVEKDIASLIATTNGDIQPTSTKTGELANTTSQGDNADLLATSTNSNNAGIIANSGTNATSQGNNAVLLANTASQGDSVGELENNSAPNDIASLIATNADRQATSTSQGDNAGGQANTNGQDLANLPAAKSADLQVISTNSTNALPVTAGSIADAVGAVGDGQANTVDAAKKVDVAKEQARLNELKDELAKKETKSEAKPVVVTEPTAAEIEKSKEQKAPPPPPAEAVVPESKIVINVASRGLFYYKNGVPTRLYPIAVGDISSPTPTGYYKVIEKEKNPEWLDPRDPKNIIPAGPNNPLGPRWIRFYGNYGIHGTNNPNSIGNFTSNGCIRMNSKDVLELYDLIKLGTPVEITYNRVVVEKAPDDTVVYYIYPDGYKRQPLTTADVRKWLNNFGVGELVGDEEIQAKISQADGNPTYVAKAYPVSVNGAQGGLNAVVKNGITYLDVAKLSQASGVSVQNQGGVLISSYGKAPSYDFAGSTYINSDDLAALYNLEGGLTNKVYQLYTPLSN